MSNKNLQPVLLAVLLFLLAACSGEKEEAIASIGDSEVTADEFQAYLDFKRIKINDDQQKQSVLDQYLQREALSRAIEARQDDKAKAMTAAELAEFRRQITISRYFERYLKDAVNDEKIRNYYLSNQQKYSQEKVQVAHILLRLQRDMSEPDRKVRLTRINEIYSKLKAGADFAETARELSEDTVSSRKGGGLGWMKKGAIDARFSEQMFKLGKDEISEPFETPFGYHIIKVLAPASTTTQSLESVTGDIRYILRQQAKRAHEAELKAALKIEKAQ
ncbi:MAG: peptidylprolyl isomerase [Gammaproteobacteria bacterium]|nr:peptidylprolyl isomerase [Gammaproteobacteria bacterium]